MSESQVSFFGDQTKIYPTEMDTVDPEVLPTLDPNSDDEHVTSEDEKEGSDKQKPKQMSYTNSEYADMKGDPSMSYEYSSGRPAAGYPTVHNDRNGEPIHTSRRHYKTADDAFDTGINQTGTSSPWPRSRESTPEPDRKFYTSSEYANMKGDPSMSYEYSSGRAAAGYPSRPHTPQSTDPTGMSFHHDKMDGDTFDTEINKSGTSSPQPRSKESTPAPVPVFSTGSQNGDIEPEGQTYSNEEYAEMKGDPSMSYEYSSGRPAAGYPSSPHITLDREIDEDEDEDEKDGSDEIVKPEGILYSNSEYANMKGDPKMSYEYSSGRPAAGCRTSNTSRYNF